MFSARKEMPEEENDFWMRDEDEGRWMQKGREARISH